MTRRAVRKLLFSFVFCIAVIAAFIFGVVSVRSQNAPFKVLKSLEKKLFSKDVPRRTGIWGAARETATKGLSKDQREALEDLADLPYLKGYKAASGPDNVTIYDEQSAYNGLNFVVSSDAPNAFLMDMKGEILHRWRKNFGEVWPEPFSLGGPEIHREYWKRARLLQNGDVLAIFTDFGLIKLDRDSNLLWAYKARCHHDMFEAENGNIYVLTRSDRKNHNLRLQSISFGNRIWDDAITILSADGHEIRTISLLKCFVNSEFAPVLEHVKEPIDLVHANTIRMLDGRLADTHPMFKKGHILVSLRDIHTIAVVDPVEEKITWAMTGMWKYQHEPRLLRNGNIMLFDNRGHFDKSKIVEVNPLTQEVVWTYKGDPPRSFYSFKAGTNERLPNGNTLVTESTQGRAFEVTPEGRIVWEFLNPNRAGENKELIAALYDVVRFDPGFVAWLSPGRGTN